MTSPVNVVMCGTGEYTTGFVGTGGSQSDKKIGVVGLVMFDLRRRGKIGTIGLVGTNGTKFPAIRKHLEEKIAKVYRDMDTSAKTWPADTVASQPDAYKEALDSLRPGDIITVFTPDDTHYEIALYGIRKGLHVMLTKPPVKTLKEHLHLIEEADKKGVLVAVDYHKRFDPIYIGTSTFTWSTGAAPPCDSLVADARYRVRSFGDFGYFNSYMSQPKFQLNTFKSWAGKSSDISYYLNSHHVDYHTWCLEGLSKPVRVVASAAKGVAESAPYHCPKGTEDTITLLVDWENDTGTRGVAVYTASWTASAKSEVHTQQRFHYMGAKGETRIDQAHRGYEIATDETGYANVNPLYMSYQPDAEGRFQGQSAYGYVSFEKFVDATIAINAGKAKPRDYDASLPTLRSTLVGTAILEAGRRSLDNKGSPVRILYDSQGNPTDLSVCNTVQ